MIYDTCIMLPVHIHPTLTQHQAYLCTSRLMAIWSTS